MELSGTSRNVFISSTVRDLGDLRSAIRYFLEQYGFQVFTSENTDFPHGTTQEAWRAGLEAIGLADYYVLVIGDNYGTVVDDGLSVTHHEFRRARSIADGSGRPGMIFFIRRRVLQALNEGRDLEGASGREGIASLAREVRNAATPSTANWIHAFDSFSEIADSLRATLRLTGPLRRRALEANLLSEVEENSQRLIVKLGDLTLPAHEWLPHSELPPVEPGVEVERNESQMFAVRVLFLLAGRISDLREDALGDALLSGEFLTFDTSSGQMSAGAEVRLLRQLRARQARLRELATYLRSPHLVEQFARLPPAAGALTLDIATGVYSFRDELENVGLTLRAVYTWLTGGEPLMPQTRPPSPIAGQAERIAREEVTVDEARHWLRGS